MRLLRLLDGGDDRGDAGVGLNDELHTSKGLSAGCDVISKLLASSG